MKIVIFAGGVGTRLWPLSRKSTPKQFEKIIGDKSTLQQTVDRLLPDFNYTDIFISTGKRYEKTVLEQLPEIPRENFIFEPEMRDVGPAIGLRAEPSGLSFCQTREPFDAIRVCRAPVTDGGALGHGRGGRVQVRHRRHRGAAPRRRQDEENRSCAHPLILAFTVTVDVPETGLTRTQYVPPAAGAVTSAVSDAPGFVDFAAER